MKRKRPDRVIGCGALDVSPLRTMLLISLSLNVLVLIPVLATLALNGAAASDAWGVDTAARRILSAIYAAILAMSVALLALQLLGRNPLAWAQALLAVQVVYKVLSAPFVGFRNPVVISNLLIATVHATTLALTAGTLR
ncbi:MAG TPA: hypothetical protein VHD90_21435 [Phototrophicaceae bacterium]|nr:hypothetical protein [Phototrophicaceae bacterium]